MPTQRIGGPRDTGSWKLVVLFTWVICLVCASLVVVDTISGKHDIIPGPAVTPTTPDPYETNGTLLPSDPAPSWTCWTCPYAGGSSIPPGH